MLRDTAKILIKTIGSTFQHQFLADDATDCSLPFSMASQLSCSLNEYLILAWPSKGCDNHSQLKQTVHIDCH